MAGISTPHGLSVRGPDLVDDRMYFDSLTALFALDRRRAQEGQQTYVRNADGNYDLFIRNGIEATSTPTNATHWTAAGSVVNERDGSRIRWWCGSQSEYDSLVGAGMADANTFYAII